MIMSSPESNHPPEISEQSLHYKLDGVGQETMSKLAGWSKFVGIMNIIFGVCYAASIILLSIPTFIMGVILIIIGTKLLNAAGHLRYALTMKDSNSFSHALDQIRSFMALTGILYIIGIVAIVLVLSIVFIFGIALFDFFSDPGFDYTI